MCSLVQHFASRFSRIALNLEKPRLGYDQVVFPFRIATLLASFVAYSAVVDPGGFSTKVLARFPKLGSTARRLKSDSGAVDSLARRLERVGEYTQALESAGPAARIRLRNAIAELNLTPDPIPSRSPQSARPPRPKATNLTVVAPITNSLPYTQAGYSLRTHELLSAVSKLGTTVHAITRPGYPVIVGRTPRATSEDIDGVIYHRNLPRLIPHTPEATLTRASDGIVRLAKKVDANVIHTTSRFTNGLAARSGAAELSLPWIYEVRGREERTWLASLPRHLQADAIKSERYRLSEMHETQCLHDADHVIALSEIMRQEFIEEGIQADKITVIPNGVDDKIFDFTMTKEEARARLGLPSKKIVGTISSLVRYEGIETLIRAGQELPEDYRILIVGDGEDKQRLQELTTSLGLDDRVYFAGAQPVSTIWTWHRALDAFIVPRADTLVTRTVTPIKPLAAQALRVPVVASDLPALREVTGGHATYVQPDSPDLLVQAVVQASNFDTKSAYWHATSRSWGHLAERLKYSYSEL